MMVQARSGISGTHDVSRVERGWAWLTKYPCYHDWDIRYAHWLTWVQGVSVDSLSPAVATIAASLEPTFFIPHSEHFITDRRPCPYCGAMIWSGTARHPGSKPDSGSPLLLNERPSAWGRWLIQAPGIATFCAGIAMIEWPLPRYTSHLVDCGELVQAREWQREEKAEAMRWGKERQAENRAQKKERREAYFAQFEEAF